MQLFSRNKDRAVQSLILKIVNNNCREVDSLNDGPRLEGRVNLTVATIVVPLENNRLALDQAFTAVTKEFSTTGTAIVLDEPLGLDEAILGFRWEREMHWVRAKAKHLSPIGGGFFQLGFRLMSMIYIGDYPGLGSLVL